MTMWDFASQYPEEFFWICLIAFIALENIVDSIASVYKSRQKKGGDNSC